MKFPGLAHMSVINITPEADSGRLADKRCLNQLLLYIDKQNHASVHTSQRCGREQRGVLAVLPMVGVSPSLAFTVTPSKQVDRKTCHRNEKEG